MNKDDFIQLRETHKELILKIVDLCLFFNKRYISRYKGEKVDYIYKEGKVRVMPLDEKLEEVVDKLLHAEESFRGYKMDNGQLVQSYSDVAGWIDRVKKTRGFNRPADIKKRYPQRNGQAGMGGRVNSEGPSTPGRG